ncbi:MAG: NAD(P)/FAD-dependent oxidoreductase [Candidatus Eisenbacteria bacterium]
MSVELLVVGAGPAGVSAALWAKALELDVLLLDGAPVPGGQLHSVYFHPQDVPGFEQGDGPALAASYARQLAAASVPLRTASMAAALEPRASRDGVAHVRLADGETLSARAVLVASGVRRRRLEVPGEREFEGRGVSFSATRDKAELAGRSVVVVGGGDAAFENALLLAQAGSRVAIVVRETPIARPEFRACVAAAGIAVFVHTRVLSVLGDSRARALRVSGPEGERELAAEGFVIKIGVLPNTEWCRSTLACDADGYLRVDERLATSAPGVWAAGDVTRPQPPSIPVAIGQGAQAIAMIRADLRPR